jgi:predicted transcriptional regulator
VRLDVSVAEATKAKLDELAKSERRPMNYVVCSLLNQVLGIDEDSGTAVPAPQVEAPERRKASNGATVMLNISLQPDLKAAVKTIAKVERRTASNMASLMIRDWIEQWTAKHPGVNVWPDAEEE